ncbi:hypothetical protein ACHHYP_14360 [Achlya hypogyna]|uniref:Uncharacterized protein n=1 Tax=Achlya hypogyna TaxID=1202772 RepID=A0A1V9YDF4_ACHHY|nr:hypothetical protein ACHHYP_14360 [Achlya hypogyna]
MTHEANKFHTLSFPPIQTLTIFPRIDVEAIATRVQAIVAANPWLLGRLATGPNGTIELQYDDTPDKQSRVFQYVTAPAEKNALAYVADVVSGHEGLNAQHQCLFQVVVLDMPDGTAGLIVALNHTIGDGWTYYALYKMLDGEAAVRGLNPTRVLSNASAVFASTSPFTAIAMKSSFVVSRMLYHVLVHIYRKFVPRPRTTVTYRVSHEEVKRQKEAHKPTAAAPFLSTNDIVVSAVFRASDTALGAMAVNIRDRLNLGKMDVAGNYISAFAYTRKDFASPALVRESIRNKLAPHEKPTKEAPPTAWDTGKFTLITNWTSFYHSLVLEPGVAAISHKPLSRPAFLPFDAVAILYNHTPNEMRVLVRDNCRLPTPLFEQMIS